MPRAMADAGLISGLALMGLATQHPSPASCEKCQSSRSACEEGSAPTCFKLGELELGPAIVRYSGLGKSLYHASGETLEAWLSRFLGRLEFS